MHRRRLQYLAFTLAACVPPGDDLTGTTEDSSHGSDTTTDAWSDSDESTPVPAGAAGPCRPTNLNMHPTPHNIPRSGTTTTSRPPSCVPKPNY